MVPLIVKLSLFVLVVHSYSTVASDDVNRTDTFDMDLPDDILFKQFKIIHERKYKNISEEEKRRKIFIDNVRTIRNHNAKYANGESTYAKGINQFADQSDEDFETKAAKCFKGSVSKEWSTFMPPENYKAPAEVNWVLNGSVTSVKNQGECGSCWAFGSVGAIEGQLVRNNRQLIDLSPQQLVDCSKNGGNIGCNGGYVHAAFEYVMDVGGIQAEIDYRYTGKSDGNCSPDKTKFKVTVQSYMKVPADEQSLQKAVAIHGPVAVAVFSCDEFHRYSTGVLNNQTCVINDLDDLDHVVLVVGYGYDANAKLDYWLVKNSYDTDFGDAGYIKIARNKDNMCGISSEAFFPIVQPYARYASPNNGPKNPNVFFLTFMFIVMVMSSLLQ